MYTFIHKLSAFSTFTWCKLNVVLFTLNLNGISPFALIANSCCHKKSVSAHNHGLKLVFVNEIS